MQNFIIKWGTKGGLRIQFILKIKNKNKEQEIRKMKLYML